MEYFVIAFFVMVFNVLDSVTTHIALNKLPQDIKATESNPVMRGLLIKHPLFAEIIKQGSVIGLITWVVLSHDLFTLKVMMLMLVLVVSSNTYLVVGRKVTRKKIKSPLHKLAVLLHIPNKVHFMFFVTVIFSASFSIAWFLWK